ncbi:MAG: aminotransferase class IV [Chitinophagales bacterium]|nr:aminotransferase class IV [Chitinophagales bacterium]MDW8420208.1 aminotransferase class IV [Chitinophagales bacterium]
MQYINFNGNIYKESEPLIPVSNRSFRYGDGFFESIAMFQKKFPLLQYHWNRVMRVAEFLGCRLPGRLNEESFVQMVLDLASVNDCVNARVRLQFYRKGGGFYKPEEDELGYAIEMFPIAHTRFEAGAGIHLGIYPEYKPVSSLSLIKSSSALYYVMAAKWCAENGYDECIVANAGYDEVSKSIVPVVSEAISSNVILPTPEALFIVSDDEYPVDGVMQEAIIDIFGDEIEIAEAEISEAHLLQAREIWLVNAVQGIRWVSKFQDVTYTNTLALQYTELLNQRLGLI